MSSAAAPAADAPAKKGGSKKLIIIIAAVVLLLVVGGGAAFMMMSKKAAADEDGGEAQSEKAEAPKKDKKKDKEKEGEHKAPTFIPLDPFTVNLADRGADRYLQVGLSLQVEDEKLGEQIKGYMPAIRNSILMILSHKTAEELTTTEGKEKLSEEIRREAARAMGYEIEDEDAPPKEEAGDAPAEGKKKKKKKKKAEVENPIVHVHYSNFIIQ